MLVTSPQYISYNTIIWQLGTECKHQCPGCYVYGVRKKWWPKPEGDFTGKVLAALYGEEPTVGCQELIVSTSKCDESDEQLARIATRHYNAKQLGKQPFKLRLALHKIDPWDERERVIIETVDSLSISQGNFSGQWDKPTIWNTLITEVTQPSFLKNLKNILAGTTYLILPKPMLGFENKFNWRPWAETLIALDGLRATDNEPSISVQVDRCVLCVYKSLVENREPSCHTDVSTMCIWPNGQLTSCPYDTMGQGAWFMITDIMSVNQAARALRTIGTDTRTRRASSECSLFETNSSWAQELFSIAQTFLERVVRDNGLIRVSREKLGRLVA